MRDQDAIANVITEPAVIVQSGGTKVVIPLSMAPSLAPDDSDCVLPIYPSEASNLADAMVADHRGHLGGVGPCVESCLLMHAAMNWQVEDNDSGWLYLDAESFRNVGEAIRSIGEVRRDLGKDEADLDATRFLLSLRGFTSTLATVTYTLDRFDDIRDVSSFYRYSIC